MHLTLMLPKLPSKIDVVYNLACTASIKAQLDNEANEIKNIEILNHMQNIINERFMRVK